MLRLVMQLFFRLVSAMKFLSRNAYRAYFLQKFSSERVDGYYLESLQRNKVKELSNLYSVLNNGTDLSLENKLLLCIWGSRYCLVAKNDNGKVIGCSIFYYNDRDIGYNIIHEGFTGILLDYRGKKIGTQMGKKVLNHFTQMNLGGISQRISSENKASIARSLSLGYSIVENYIEQNTGEQYYYMIKDLLNIYDRANK